VGEKKEAGAKWSALGVSQSAYDARGFSDRDYLEKCFWLPLISLRAPQHRPEPRPRRPFLSSWERGCAIPIREALIEWLGAHSLLCSARQLELESVKAYHVGAWLDQHPGSRSTQRQHLAAVRLLFDSLMMRRVVEYNPAARAKPPRLVRESSHTPVFEEAEIVAFLDSISSESLKDVRDKAIFSVLFYSWCRVSALINLYRERRRHQLRGVVPRRCLSRVSPHRRGVVVGEGRFSGLSGELPLA
jgi:hypothetical protein